MAMTTHDKVLLKNTRPVNHPWPKASFQEDFLSAKRSGTSANHARTLISKSGKLNRSNTPDTTGSRIREVKRPRNCDNLPVRVAIGLTIAHSIVFEQL